MRKLSDTLKELGVVFSFPIKIMDANGNVTYSEESDGDWCKVDYDANGNRTYFEDRDGFWEKSEYDANCNETYFEDSNGYWWRSEYDANGNQTYSEDSDGVKKGTPRSSKSCNGKVIEVDGKKYKLTEL
jgi:YD repeat-containing protein